LEPPETLALTEDTVRITVYIFNKRQ
jgi:hypothetical protein